MQEQRTCPQGHPYESISSGFVMCRACREIEKLSPEGTTVAGTDRELAYELAELLTHAYYLVEEYRALQEVSDAGNVIAAAGERRENDELFADNRELITQNRLLVETIAGYSEFGNYISDLSQRAIGRDKALTGAATLLADALPANLRSREAQPLYTRLETAARTALVYLQHMKLQLAETLELPLREIDQARNSHSGKEEGEPELIMKLKRAISK